MKLFSAGVLCLLVALASACTTDSCTKTETNDEIEKALPRDKRTIGLDKNFEKEVEIKTKSGTSIKLSENFGFKGGNTKNKVGIYQQLENDHHHGVNQVNGYVSVGSQINVNTGTSIFGHQGGLMGLFAAKHELLSRKLASIGHLTSHEKLHRDLHGKPGGLHAFFTAHHALLARKKSGKMLTAAETKPTSDSCCPTGTYCGN